MGLIVHKYGGTSVGSLERIRAVAERVARVREGGDRVVVVVSAMSGETDRLLGLGKQLAPRPNEREMDSLAATGEQVSAALLSIALGARGVPAESLVGHQARILTDGVFTKARIRAIDGAPVLAVLERGVVPVVAGFQGLDANGNITTLGRGGTDTTAVAVAAALSADVCEIYTDVDGVYTTDPNICPDARKLDRITFDEMLEFASLGAKVLQLRSVEAGKKHGMPIAVRSSFNDNPGTIVGAEDQDLEAVVVTAVACDKNEVKLTIPGLPDRPGVVASVFGALAEANISVDIITQAAAVNGATDLTFTVPRVDMERARDVATEAASRIGARPPHVDAEVAKVSIVGAGMRSHPGVAARMFQLLADSRINIHAITTSEIRVSCLIGREHAETAVRVLHDGFGLAQGG